MRAWRSPSPRGVCARDLDDEHRHTLRQLLAVYTGRAPRDLAGAYTARYESDPVLDEVYFAWAGSTDAGEPHYYRVQGPAFLSSTTTPNGMPTTPIRSGATLPPTSDWTHWPNTGRTPPTTDAGSGKIAG